MDIKLFRWIGKAASAESPAPKSTPESRGGHPRQGPPCTNNCFQGRACPASSSADVALVTRVRRSPLL